jgi:hypothetical protein
LPSILWVIGSIPSTERERERGRKKGGREEGRKQEREEKPYMHKNPIKHSKIPGEGIQDNSFWRNFGQVRGSPSALSLKQLAYQSVVVLRDIS